jgi:hypothetical protein
VPHASGRRSGEENDSLGGGGGGGGGGGCGGGGGGALPLSVVQFDTVKRKAAHKEQYASLKFLIMIKCRDLYKLGVAL